MSSQLLLQRLMRPTSSNYRVNGYGPQVPPSVKEVLNKMDTEEKQRYLDRVVQGSRIADGTEQQTELCQMLIAIRRGQVKVRF